MLIELIIFLIFILNTIGVYYLYQLYNKLYPLIDAMLPAFLYMRARRQLIQPQLQPQLQPHLPQHLYICKEAIILLPLGYQKLLISEMESPLMKKILTFVNCEQLPQLCKYG